MSVLEIWGAEYQENDCLLLKQEDRAAFDAICSRERCSMQACSMQGMQTHSVSVRTPSALPTCCAHMIANACGSCSLLFTQTECGTQSWAI